MFVQDSTPPAPPRVSVLSSVTDVIKAQSREIKCQRAAAPALIMRLDKDGEQRQSRDHRLDGAATGA